MSQNQEAAGKKKPDKGQVKVLVLVGGIPAGTTELNTTLQIADQAPITKTVSIDDVTDASQEDDSEDAQGIMFNKLQAKQDDPISVNVNGVSATSTVTSTKGKPNRILVSLSSSPSSS